MHGLANNRDAERMTGDMAEGNISANDQAILELLENDARLDARDLADILGEEAQEVQQAVRRMEEQKVAIVPGTAFGDSGEGFVRISYATSTENIKEACSRIEAFLESLHMPSEPVDSHLGSHS